MSRPINLLHPKVFKAKIKSLKGVSDMNERISTRFDNQLLKSQSKLVDRVLKNEVSLPEFQSAIDNFQESAAEHAQLRPGGVTQKEWRDLTKRLKQTKSPSEIVVQPATLELFEALQSGSLATEEAVDELNWKSEQKYGEEASLRDGIIFRDERPKLRAHLYSGKSAAKAPDTEAFLHPKLESFLQDIKSIFPQLDQNGDRVIDRIESRQILSHFQELGISPSTATTFYSRQKEIASAHEPEAGNLEVSLNDLNTLAPHNHPTEPNTEFQNAVSRISKRLDFEENRPSLEETPFTLGQNFEPSNVHQGREESCWVLCNLPNLNSEELEQIIQPEGEQYRLSLKDGRSTLVSPLNEAERRIYSHGDGQWSGLLEKGISQLLAEENRHISGGPASEAREFLAGEKLQQKTLLKKDNRPDAPELRDRNVLFETLETTLDTGGVVIASALPEDFEKGISEISAAGHGYTVLGINREQDELTLKNPWGRGEAADHDGTNDGIFTLTQDQFFANYSLIEFRSDSNQGREAH